MVVTPSQLFSLAVRRHREPWNWTFHFAAAWLFGLALLLHSYLVLAASLILFGTGFFSLNLGPVPDNRWFAFVRGGIEWERNWSALPWKGRKTVLCALTMVIAGVTFWALWTREAATLGLVAGFMVLGRVVTENRKNGIDP